GTKEATGFLSVVGMAVGEEILKKYEQARGCPLDRSSLAGALVDFKRRVGGDFYVIEDEGRRVVLGKTRCPFGEAVKGRPSLCMMTSNIFGHFAAEAQGYGRVTLDRTIASGDSCCRITIDLDVDNDEAGGRRYHRTRSRHAGPVPDL